MYGKITSTVACGTGHPFPVQSHDALPRTIEVGFKLYSPTDAGIRQSPLRVNGRTIRMPPTDRSVVGVEIPTDRHFYMITDTCVIVADTSQAVADAFYPQFHSVGPRECTLREQDPSLPHTGHRLCLQEGTGQEQEQSGHERRLQAGIDHHVK
ncbi:MAG: hypothetical protein LW694_12135 [Chitinophagaceae bacterium]|nr:hypothetical protein [Chitinophagaceae bacterium]